MTSAKKPGRADRLFDKTAAGRPTANEITPALEYWVIILRLIQKRKRLLRKRAALLIQFQRVRAEANAGLQAAYKRRPQ